MIHMEIRKLSENTNLYKIGYKLSPDGKYIYYTENGSILLFDKQNAAEAFRKSLATRHKDYTFEVCDHVDDGSWIERECSRFARGHYARLPWASEPWAKETKENGTEYHFAHVSRQDPSKVAFIESRLKGVRDIHTKMKPGKYLQTYYENLPKYEIQRWSEVYNSERVGEIKFAKTREEIKWIYTQETAAPGSCMRYQFINNAAHPAEVYASGDIEVAYLEKLNPDYDTKNKIPVARAIVSPKNKSFGRVFALNSIEEANFKALMLDAGYKSVRTLDGSKILKIPASIDNGSTYKSYIMPYIDYAYINEIEDDPDHFVICEPNSFSPDLIRPESANGYLTVHNKVGCDSCSKKFRVNYGFTVYANTPKQQFYCNDCNDKIARCDYCAAVVLRNDVKPSYRWSDNRNYLFGNLCEGCVRRECFTCSKSYRITLNRDRKTLANGMVVSIGWYNTNREEALKIEADYRQTIKYKQETDQAKAQNILTKVRPVIPTTRVMYEYNTYDISRDIFGPIVRTTTT